MISSPNRIEPLSKEAFAPFGNVLEVPSGPPDLHDQVFSMWIDQADIGLLGDQGTIVYIVNKRRPFVLNCMETHRGLEVFFPVKGESVLAVAPRSDDLPKPEGIRFFYINTSRPYMIYPRIWHWSTFPLTEEAAFFLLFAKGLPRKDVRIEEILPLRIEL